MGLMDRLWAATKFLVKIEDKVERLSDTVKFQQQKIDALNERLLRLEMLVQFGPQKDHVFEIKTIESRDGQQPRP
jgi:hypothetical protein